MVHIVQTTSGKPHQLKGDYKEYQELYPFVAQDPNQPLVRTMFDKLIGLCRDGTNQDLKLTADDVPQKIRLYDIPKSYKIRDAFRILNGLPYVSDPLRDLIERFDPGVHSFFPTDVTLPADRKPDSGYNLFAVRAQKDTIIPEHSSVRRDEEFGGEYYSLSPFATPDRKASFTTDCLKGAHIWREKKIYGGELFLSDALMEAMVSEDIKYFKTWYGAVESS